jgi:uncharacterized protein
MEKRGLALIALAIIAGMIFGAFILGKSIERFRSDDRFISVKGFAEREVKSDFVIWTLQLRMAVNDLDAGSKSMEASRNKVMQFLTKNGINADEIIQQNLTVLDKQAREYDPASTGSFRYIIEENIEVRSTNVDLVQKVSRMTGELLNAGVVLSSGNDYRGNSLRFIFTKLNDVKPAMLSEAIQNAKQAAEQFTKESNTKLGKLRKASQGYFTVADREAFLTQQTEGNYYGNVNSDVFKKIRVVVSVDYSIE